MSKSARTQQPLKRLKGHLPMLSVLRTCNPGQKSSTDRDNDRVGVAPWRCETQFSDTAPRTTLVESQDHCTRSGDISGANPRSGGSHRSAEVIKQKHEPCPSTGSRHKHAVGKELVVLSKGAGQLGCPTLAVPGNRSGSLYVRAQAGSQQAAGTGTVPIRWDVQPLVC